MTTAMATAAAVANTGYGLQIGAEVSVLKKKFEAIIENNETGMELLVAPEKAASQGQGVTIAELIKELTAFYNNLTEDKTPVDEQTIINTISKVVDPNNLSIDLSQLFLHIKNTGEKKNNLLEYAFKIAVYYTKLDPALASLFTFESVYFAIWNTTLPGVVDSMGLKSIDSILKEYE